MDESTNHQLDQDDILSSLPPLLLGYTARELFYSWVLVLPCWCLLIVAPRWEYTRTLTLIAPLVHAVIYMVCIIQLMVMNKNTGAAIFLTLEGVNSLFENQSVVFCGWIHYLCFDLLVGRFIALDAIEQYNVSAIDYVQFIVPSLFLTFFLGPVGFFLYSCIRTFVLVAPSREEKQKPQ